MKRKISVLLCAVMMLTLFVGCGEKESIAGTWETTLALPDTMASAINQTIAESAPELQAQIDISGLFVTVRATFNEDGTYATAITPESVENVKKSISKQIAEALTAYANKVATESGVELDMAEVFGLAEGQTLEDKVASLFNADELNRIIESSQQSGFYKIEEGKLYTAATDGGFSESAYETYKLDGATLEITGVAGADDAVAAMEGKYPIVYKKVTE